MESRAPPCRSSPPTSSEPAGCQGAARAARSAGSGAAPRRLPLWLAAPRRRSTPGTRSRATGHGPAQGTPDGLGAQPMARYVLLLLPLASGNPPWSSGASDPAARSGTRCASQGPILATLWGRGSPRNWLQSSGPAKFRKSGRRVEATWSGEFGVFWEELKRLELKSAAGWPHRTPHWTRWTPRATPGFPRHHQGHSGVSGAPRARAGKGMGRAERALPRCPNARRGGRILQCGEPGTEALEGWGDLGAESSPESVPPRTKRTLARQPQGGGEQSPARPKAAGRNSAVQRSRKRYLTLGVGTEH